MSRRAFSILVTCLTLTALGMAAPPVRAQYVYAIRSDGVMLWYEHLGATNGTFNWVGPLQPSAGWQNFQAVFPGGEGVIYAIQTDGTLLWYKHTGYHDGSVIWEGPITVGSAWQGFRQVFSGGDGIIYALQSDGTLLWYKHVGWQSGGATWEGPYVVGVGWQNFQSVFPGDGGSIYAIQTDGTLLWYRHLGRDYGGFLWDGPYAVGSSWQGFQRVFASANGVIYAIQTNGDLVWYRHRGYLDGSVSWDGPSTVGNGWSFANVFAEPEPLEGYCWPLSAAPGETISFSVSSPSEYQVTYARYRRNGDQNASIPVSAPQAESAGLQAVPSQPWQNGCGWGSSFQLQVPAGWPSGIYAAECTDPVGRTSRISFIVKPQAGQHGTFAILANTNTWNSYNSWGGESKYSNPPAQAVSYLRPNPYAVPIDAGGVNHLTRAELWVDDWLSTTGYLFDTYADIDMHRGIPGLAGYKALIVHTHPEYWTPQMRDNLEAYIAGGGSVLYMGGNGMFEEVLLSPDCTTQTLFPGGQYPWRDPSYFRNLNPPRPERNLLGVAYRYDNYFTFRPFQVLQADHHLFAGTGLANGDSIGVDGINGGGASGWEMDTSIPGNAADGVIVSAYGSDDRGTPPANIELLARGKNVGNDGSFGADMTYYRTPAGGFVFCAGSISFGGSLVIDPALQQIVRNALRDAIPTADADNSDRTANGFALGPNEPNPFRSGTTIRYVLPGRTAVRLAIFNVQGQEVTRLVDGVQDAGEHFASWDGFIGNSARADAGVYLYKLESGVPGQNDRHALNGKMVLVR